MEIYVNGVHYKQLINHVERQELKKVLTDECRVALYHKPAARVPSLMEKSGDCRFLSNEEIRRHVMQSRTNTWLGEKLATTKSKREQIVQCLLKGDKVGTKEITKLIKTLMPVKLRKGIEIDELAVSNYMCHVMRAEFGKHISKTKLSTRWYYQIDDFAFDLSLDEAMRLCKAPGIVKLAPTRVKEVGMEKQQRETNPNDDFVERRVESREPIKGIVGEPESIEDKAVRRSEDIPSDPPMPVPEPQGLDALVAKAIAAGHEVIIKFKPAE